jgi:hypothetical protein
LLEIAANAVRELAALCDIEQGAGEVDEMNGSADFGHGVVEGEVAFPHQDLFFAIKKPFNSYFHVFLFLFIFTLFYFSFLFLLPPSHTSLILFQQLSVLLALWRTKRLKTSLNL